MGGDPGSDGIAYAAQIGRLDFITTVLAILASALTLATIPVFFYLKRKAEFVAQREAKAALADVSRIAEEVAIKKMEQMLPILISEYRELAQNVVSSEQADRIAEAQDDDPNVS